MGDRRELARLAASQRGVFNVHQVRALGFDRSAVTRRLGSGEWVRLDHSVYGLASAPPTWERILTVALLSRPGSALTHQTASALHGLDGFAKCPPVLLVPRGSNVRSDTARLFESDQFERIAKTTVDDFTVTTVPETLLTLARDFRGPRLEEIFDEALIAGKLDLGAMARILDREAGRRTPGAPALRRLVTTRRPSAPAKSSTYLEAMMEFILRDPRVPPWVREFPVSIRGTKARVDFFIPSCKLILEGDGRNWHTRRTDFENDRRRDNALAVAGYQVMRFTYSMLKTEPDECLEQVIAVANHRAA